jgi:uncharacterized membrane protein YjjB (DUF3815 family)
MQELINILQWMMNNPWMLLFISVWVIGWFLKEKTNINNKLIPWIVLIVAMGLGFYLLERSVAGIIIGALIGYIMIGFYSQIKNTIEFVLKPLFLVNKDG